MSELPFHALANLFPLIEGRNFDDMVADVAANGVREAIVLHEGAILDGRNRYRASRKAGLFDEAIHCREFRSDRDGEPLAFVLSKNLHRRHLTTSQRALIGARIAQMCRGRPTGTAGTAGTSTAVAAQSLKISSTSIERGRVLLQRGDPDLVRRVEIGELSISAGARLAQMSAAAQAEAIASGRSLVAEARRSRCHAGLSARGAYVALWRRVDEICNGLEVGRLELADLAARELSRAIGLISEGRRHV